MAKYVIAFDSTHAALAASKALSDAGEHFLTIPVPRAISAGCGIALSFETEDASDPDGTDSAVGADDAAPTLALVRASGAAGRGALYCEEGRDAFERVEEL